MKKKTLVDDAVKLRKTVWRSVEYRAHCIDESGGKTWSIGILFRLTLRLTRFFSWNGNKYWFRFKQSHIFHNILKSVTGSRCLSLSNNLRSRKNANKIYKAVNKQPEIQQLGDFNALIQHELELLEIAFRLRDLYFYQSSLIQRDVMCF